MLLVCAGGLLYFNYWMRFVFSNFEFFFFQIFQKPGTLWISCTRDALPVLGYVQYLGDLPEGNMGILPFTRRIFRGPGPTKNSLWLTLIRLKRI
jgi:hypothetical protein